MQVTCGILTFVLLFLLTLTGRISPPLAAQASPKVAKGPRASPGLADVTWAKYRDPYEHAFTVDVPQGWTVTGGLFRLGYSDYRPMLDLQSPDGNIEIRSGDVAIPSYWFPTQYHPKEGEINDLGAQAQGVYAKYRTGKEFAGLYLLAHFKTRCQALIPLEVDQTSPVKETDSGQPGVDTKTSAGAVAYRCDSGQNSRIAYVYARTTVSPPSLWQVVTLVSYLAEADRASMVRGILMHGSQSFLLNPQWVEDQKKMDADGLKYQVARQRQRLQAIGQQAQQVEARMLSMQNQVRAFQHRQNAQARQVESFGNVLTGITPTVDPLNGQTRNVWTGPRSGYWINGQGTIVNANTPPGAGYRQLQP